MHETGEKCIVNGLLKRFLAELIQSDIMKKRVAVIRASRHFYHIFLILKEILMV
jgi:hypothetical protein